MTKSPIQYRPTVGISNHMAVMDLEQPVVDALVMSVWRRANRWRRCITGPRQYTSEHYQILFKEQGITCSVSRAGVVWDNSAMASFFSSLQSGRAARKMYGTREQAQADVFNYIEWFYNPTRRHLTLKYVSPVQFEETQIALVGINGNGSSPFCYMPA